MPAILALITALAPLLAQLGTMLEAQIKGAQGPSPGEVAAALKAAHAALGDAVAALEVDLVKQDAEIDAEIKAGTLTP